MAVVDRDYNHALIPDPDMPLPKRVLVDRACLRSYDWPDSLMVLSVNTTWLSGWGAGKAFAPSRDMVRAYQRGLVTEFEFAQRYYAKLDLLSRENWEELYHEAVKPRMLTVLCYCRDGQFCHTHLMIEYMVEYYPDMFQDMRKFRYPLPWMT